MALVTICDVCGALLDRNTNEVKIEFRFKRTPESLIRVSETINLCEDCFKDRFGVTFEDVIEESRSKDE